MSDPELVSVRGDHLNACTLYATGSPHIRIQKAGAVALALYLQRDPREAIDWTGTASEADVRGRHSCDVVTSAHRDNSLLVLPSRPYHGEIIVAARVEHYDAFEIRVRLQGWMHSRFLHRPSRGITMTSTLHPMPDLVAL